ncbi:MAG TPA: hypothetical protein P5550_09625 [Bacteroidales bacterium]|nr:hypothetical protein [Bacteroidales bacterium]HRZ75758.1 hypothetical protein [Bacteroidales bacterium]
MSEIRIIGLMIQDRIKEAGRTQQVLSKYSDIIRSRLGFHEVTSAVCSRVGVVLLQLTGAPSRWDELERELSGIGGIQVKHISFE